MKPFLDFYFLFSVDLHSAGVRSFYLCTKGFGSVISFL